MSNQKEITNIDRSKPSKKNRKCPVECYMKEIDGEKVLAYREPSDAKLIQDLVGTPNKELAAAIIDSGIEGLTHSASQVKKNNIVIQTLADSTPNDCHEARLATQAAVLYTQGMDFLGQAREVLTSNGPWEKREWHATLMKSATRLLDMHTRTVEALNRYRQKGEQRIVVQHVQVNDGGKAVINGILPNTGDEIKN